MILDFQDDSTPGDHIADMVVVGAGAVGLSVYADLLRKGHDVLLLEGGGSSLDLRSQEIFQQATNSGHRLDGLHQGRYRYLGGTTNFWGGQLLEFDEIVFEKREWMGSAGWPIPRAAIAPFYRRALVQLGMDSAIHSDSAVLERAGLSLPQTSSDIEYFFTRWVKTTNFARHYRADIQSDRGRVMLNANVVGLSPLEGTPTDSRHRLHIRTFDGRCGTVKARTIILACGTIETCRLLLMDYLDGTAAPWSRNPWLGKAYLDHLDFNVGDVDVNDYERFSDLFENLFINGFKYNPKLKMSESAQRRLHMVAVAGAFVYVTSYKEHADNLKIFLRSITRGRLPDNFAKFPSHCVALWKVAIPMISRYLKSSRMFHPKGSKVFLRVTSELIACSESRISLRQETMLWGCPKSTFTGQSTAEN